MFHRVFVPIIAVFALVVAIGESGIHRLLPPPGPAPTPVVQLPEKLAAALDRTHKFFDEFDGKLKALETNLTPPKPFPPTPLPKGLEATLAKAEAFFDRPAPTPLPPDPKVESLISDVHGYLEWVKARQADLDLIIERYKKEPPKPEPKPEPKPQPKPNPDPPPIPPAPVGFAEVYAFVFEDATDTDANVWLAPIEDKAIDALNTEAKRLFRVWDVRVFKDKTTPASLMSYKAIVADNAPPCLVIVGVNPDAKAKPLYVGKMPQKWEEFRALYVEKGGKLQ
jgi:hypothetical protein